MKQINISKNTMINLYVNKRLSMAKIAKRFRCDPTTICRIMHKYKIKSRSLSGAAQEIFISEQALKKLYYQDKLSTVKIGRFYSCSHATILNKMKIYDLKRRSQLGLRRPVVISKKILRNLYENRRLSQTKTAKKMKCSVCAIQKLMKKYHIKSRSYSEANTKYPKQNFSKNLLEKAYLIGFRVGDLNVYQKDFIIVARCSTTALEQIQLIQNIFSPYSYVSIRKSRILNGRQVFDVNCYLNNTFNFLLSKEDKIPKWILLNPKFFFAFFAGYIDAEGHIFVRLYKNCKTPIAGFEIQSQDKNILHQAWKKLNKLNIKCQKPKINRPKGYISKSGIIDRKDLWRLSVNRKVDLLLLLKSIEPHVKHGKRKNHLKKAKENLIFRSKKTR